MTSSLSTIALTGNLILDGAIQLSGIIITKFIIGLLSVISKDGTSDSFGYSIAVQNNIMIISSYNKALSIYTGFGTAYVYNYNGSNWTLFSTLGLISSQIAIGGASSHFGLSTSICNNWIAISAPGYKSATGAVFLYKNTAGSWGTTPLQQINYTDSGGFYGYSVSLDQITGNTLAIGQPKGNNGAGLVEIWSLTNSIWAKQATLTYSGTLRSSTQGFGYSVSLNNNILVTGGPGNIAGNGTGLAFVSQYNNGGWSTPILLNPNNGGSLDGFGASVSTRSGIIAIGSPIVSSPYGGKIYLYTSSGTLITILTVASSGTPSILDTSVTSAAKVGTSIDLDESGTILVAGASGFANTGTTSVGTAYLFQNVNGIWGPSGTTNTTNISRLDPTTISKQLFGNSVSFNHNSSNGLVVGAPGSSIQGRFYWYQ